jgi:ATP-dependent helicase HrpB
MRDPDPEAVAAALLEGVGRIGVGALPWGDAAIQLRERIAFLRGTDSGRWPDLSDARLAGSYEEWLGPHVHGLTRLDDLRRLDFVSILLGLLSWEGRAVLDELAPTHTVLPSGSRARIDYSDPAAPVLAARLQEVFGMMETPRLAGGRVALTMHLLSPARRPVQVTRDLAGFWRSGYFDVRKELKGRYPRHYWPDDPLQAEATRSVRPRK